MIFQTPLLSLKLIQSFDSTAPFDIVYNKGKQILNWRRKKKFFFINNSIKLKVEGILKIYITYLRFKYI